MMIVGLMVIALVCLATGLVLPSSAWLVASLIATAGAGYLLWKMRAAPARAHAGAAARSDPADGARHDDEPDNAQPAGDASPADAAPRGAAPTDAMSDDQTQVIEAVPADPGREDDADSTQVIAAVAAADTSSGAGDVWVIDGRPRFHVASCPIIQGQDAEPIPLEQATEDGFMPCSLCEPTATQDSLTPHSIGGRLRHSTRP